MISQKANAVLHYQSLKKTHSVDCQVPLVDHHPSIQHQSPLVHRPLRSSQRQQR
jgi:hypothetical protein